MLAGDSCLRCVLQGNPRAQGGHFWTALRAAGHKKGAPSLRAACVGAETVRGKPSTLYHASRWRKRACRPAGVRRHIPAETGEAGQEWVRLQLVLSGGGRCHEPIAVPRPRLRALSWRPLAVSPAQRPASLSLSSLAPALTVTQTLFCSSVTLFRQEGPASPAARERRQPRAFLAVPQTAHSIWGREASSEAQKSRHARAAPLTGHTHPYFSPTPEPAHQGESKPRIPVLCVSSPPRCTQHLTGPPPQPTWRQVPPNTGVWRQGTP